MKEESGEDVCHAKRSSCVARLGLKEHLDDRKPNLVGLLLEFYDFFVSDVHTSLKCEPTTSLSAPASMSLWKFSAVIPPSTLTSLLGNRLLTSLILSNILSSN